MRCGAAILMDVGEVEMDAMADHVRAMLALKRGETSPFDYGDDIRAGRKRQA